MADDLRDVIHQVRSDGRQRDTRCPIHGDTRASLSVGSGDDGRVLLHCHTGCSVESIVGAIGLSVRDLMPPKDRTATRQIVCEYRYENEHGTHLFDVIRYFPKDFKQRPADWQRRGNWKMTGVRKVLYRLPHLKDEAVVFVVEGEKDVEALVALGVAATCNPGGASQDATTPKWRGDYTRQLVSAGVKGVVVVPDNDDPGRAHANAILQSCHEVGLRTKVLALPSLPAKGDVSDWLQAGGTKAALLELAEACPVLTSTAAAEAPAEEPDDDADDDGHEASARSKRSQASELIDLAFASGMELWHTPTGDAYATIQVDGHREHHPLRRVVRDVLSRQYYRDTHRAASSAALTDAANTLGGIARFDGHEHPVTVRLAAHEGALYLDLGAPDWRMVRINARGWRVVTEAPVRHWRPASLRALPTPTPGGSLDALRDLWTLTDDDWTLTVCWLVSTRHPRGPYPVLVEVGEQGSGKSTLGRQVRGIIDPASPELRGVPRDERDVMIGALTNHVVALDNLSGLPAWLSDALCRIATGGGLATRTLYSDLDETLIDVSKPILLTGIDQMATRGDLLDRALVVTLPAMADEQRADEAGLWRRYRAMRPSLLGAVLDAVAMALRRESDVQLPRRPRMADACLWVTAAEPALGWEANQALNAWLGARQVASAELLANNTVAMAVMGLDLTEPWTGTATDLLAALTSKVDDRTAKSKTWPKTARGLSGHLRHLAPDLRRAGIDIALPVGARTARERIITIQRGCNPQDTQDRQDTSADSGQNPADPARPVECPIDGPVGPTGHQQDSDLPNESGPVSDVSCVSGPAQSPSSDVDTTTKEGPDGRRLW